MTKTSPTLCVEGVSCAKPRQQSSTLGNSSFANHYKASEDPAVGDGWKKEHLNDEAFRKMPTGAYSPPTCHHARYCTPNWVGGSHKWRLVQIKDERNCFELAGVRSSTDGIKHFLEKLIMSLAGVWVWFAPGGRWWIVLLDFQIGIYINEGCGVELLYLFNDSYSNTVLWSFIGTKVAKWKKT